MVESDDEHKNRVIEVQEILMEALALNNVKMVDGIGAMFTTSLALMKEADVSDEHVKELLMDLIKQYKALKKK